MRTTPQGALLEFYAIPASLKALGAQKQAVLDENIFVKKKSKIVKNKNWSKIGRVAIPGAEN